MKLFKDNERVAQEMIASQLNDPVVGELELAFKNVFDTYLEKGYSASSQFFKDKDCNRLFNTIDTIVFKRFGLKIKHIANDDGNYGIFVTPPINFNILNKNIENTYEYVEAEYGSGSYRPADKIETFERDGAAVIHHWYESMKAINKQLEISGIKIDLNKAKITGLPDDYILFVLCNLDFLISKKLTPLEMVAVLLHEIGHAFTHIENSYRTITNTTILIETIKENMLDKNKSLKETMVIAYEKILETSSPDLKNKDEKVIILTFASDFIRDCVGFNSAGHGETDSEQLADQFSGRFGLGTELAASLAKINYTDSDILMMYIKQFTIMSILAALYTYLSTFALAMAVSAFFATFIIMAISVIIAMLIASVLTHGNTSGGQTYDDIKQRIVRIRNELVRRLRGNHLDTNIISAIIKQLDMTDDVIRKMPEDKGNVFDKIIRSFSTKAKHMIEIKTIEQLLENTMANDLYVSSAKLNLFGAKA